MSDLTPAPMGAAEADARLARVRGHVTAAWDDLIELYLGRAWLSKGHESWAALCEAELDGARITLPRDERGQVVRRMAASGMSTRAIGQAIGVHHDTVADDIKRAPVGNPTPAPRHVDTSTGEITETAGAGEAPTRAGFTEDTSPAPATVTGLDGKTYTRPAPKPRAVPDVPAEYANPEPSYMTRFFEALAADGKALRFDPERVGREATEVEWPSVVAMRRYAEWADRAERARKGLRVIKGSAR